MIRLDIRTHAQTYNTTFLPSTITSSDSCSALAALRNAIRKNAQTMFQQEGVSMCKALEVEVSTTRSGGVLVAVSMF